MQDLPVKAMFAAALIGAHTLARFARGESFQLFSDIEASCGALFGARGRSLVQISETCSKDETFYIRCIASGFAPTIGHVDTPVDVPD